MSKPSKSEVQKQVKAGLALCDRMNEIGMPVNWFDPVKAEAFVSRGFVLVVDNSNPASNYPPILVNPENQSQFLM